MFTLGSTSFRAYIPAEVGLEEGAQVKLSLKKRGVFLFDKGTGERLNPAND